MAREIENPDNRFDPGTVVTSITASGSNLTVSNGGNGAYTISISSTPNFTSVSIGGTPIGTIAFATKMANQLIMFRTQNRLIQALDFNSNHSVTFYHFLSKGGSGML